MLNEYCSPKNSPFISQLQYRPSFKGGDFLSQPHSLHPPHLLRANSIATHGCAEMAIPVIPVEPALLAVLPPSDGLDVFDSLEVVHDQSDSLVSIPLHPLGVKPSGNQYTAHSNARYAAGFFQILPDEVLATVLEYLDASQLSLLSSSCKFLYAFCRSDDLWKALFIEYVIFLNTVYSMGMSHSMPSSIAT